MGFSDFSLASYLRKGDKFGHYATFNYRKEPGFGTIIGGLCSKLIGIFMVVVLLTQLGAILYKPRWNQIYNVRYVNTENGRSTEFYNITGGQFVPTYTIATAEGESTVYNDISKFEFYYENYRNESEPERIAAITCYDYFTGYVRSSLTESEID